MHPFVIIIVSAVIVGPCVVINKANREFTTEEIDKQNYITTHMTPEFKQILMTKSNNGTIAISNAEWRRLFKLYETQMSIAGKIPYSK